MSLFKRPSELQAATTIKVLVYGQPGTGKSTLALSAPNPVLLDFDGGVQRVNGAFQCPTLQVSSWEQVQEALKEDLVEFDTIVIDTAGKMLDFMSDYIMKNDSKMRMRDGSLALKGYGARKVMFLSFLRDVAMLGKHLVFVAHEREEKDGDLRYVRPEIGGSSMGDLIKELDIVGYVQMVGTERTISWSPQEKFYAKNTCNLPMMQKIPTIIDSSGNVTAENDFLTKIFTIYNDFLKETASTRADYDNLIEVITEKADGITDVDTANAFVEMMLTLPSIWNSKVKARQLLAEKCAELGLKYDKIAKKYVA